MKLLRIVYMDGVEDTYPLGDGRVPTISQNQVLIYGKKTTSSGVILTTFEPTPIAYIPLYNVRKVIVFGED